MKCIVIACLCVLVINSSLGKEKKTVKLPPEAANVLLLAVQRCIPQTGVSIDALLLVYQGGYSQDQKFKNFIFCCYDHAGYLTPDGRLDIEKSVKVFKNEPEVVESIRRCGEETGKNKKEALFNFFKCYQDTGSVRFSL